VSNPIPPILPDEPGDDPVDGLIVEEDGDRIVDPDADAELIDSIDADRLVTMDGELDQSDEN